ncbi:acyl-CoA thioesterase [Flaviaesturariibacter aridisoli]|uniref:Thioesterase n=1 Tax=Flaviaesturariibacter aridisoli TaxID=2545761 RepID=A0A4R4E3N2_9BACT|nr:thioesterase family protein [Flaviaesturariibacter aridisoli]RYY67060.1 MAG: thioesterase [Chitinophagaceae bacterium]TCZ74136.1 thioesterase [Flaviaesturariibacter aridisoli]
MPTFERILQVRWSDLDPNFHLRHSVYYDWGAYCRVEFLNEHGLNAQMMQQLGIGPILFREECTFRREIRSGDEVKINLALWRGRRDFSRWSFRHEIIKNGDTLAATLVVDGAWMDVRQRKLCTPPDNVHHIFESMPKTGDFEWQ